MDAQASIKSSIKQNEQVKLLKACSWVEFNNNSDNNLNGIQ